MSNSDEVLYRGEVYDDMNGVTYHLFELPNVSGDGSLIRIPKKGFFQYFGASEGDRFVLRLSKVKGVT